MGPSSNPFLIFLISILADLYIFILLIRLLLQKFQCVYFNSISQFIIKVTDPIIKPFHRIFGIYKGIDFGILILAVLIEIVVSVLILGLHFHALPNLLGVFIFSVVTLADKIISIFFYAILFDVVVSWIPALQTNPLASIAHCLANPLLTIIRRFIPLVAGIDFSPLIAIILLKFISIFLLYPIMHYSVLLSIKNIKLAT